MDSQDIITAFCSKLDTAPIPVWELSNYASRADLLNDIFFWEILVTNIVPLHLMHIERLDISALWETEIPNRIRALSTTYPDLLNIEHDNALEIFKMFWNSIFPPFNILTPRLNAGGKLTMDVNSELTVTFSQIFDKLVGFAVKLTQDDCRILEKYGKEYVTYNGIPYYIYGTVTLLPDNLAGTTPNVKFSIDLTDETYVEVKIARLLVDSEMFISLVVDKLNSPVRSNAAKTVLTGRTVAKAAKEVTRRTAADVKDVPGSGKAVPKEATEMTLPVTKEATKVETGRTSADVREVPAREKVVPKVAAGRSTVADAKEPPGNKNAVATEAMIAEAKEATDRSAGPVTGEVKETRERTTTIVPSSKKRKMDNLLDPEFDTAMDLVKSYKPVSVEQYYRAFPTAELRLYRQKFQNTTIPVQESQVYSWTIKISCNHKARNEEGQVMYEVSLFQSKVEVAVCYLEISSTHANSLDLSKYYFLTEKDQGMYMQMLVLLLANFCHTEKACLGKPERINFKFLEVPDVWIKQWAKVAMEHLFYVFSKAGGDDSVKFFPINEKQKRTKIIYHCTF